MEEKITHLRVYKPGGEMLKFERGVDTDEGVISEIFVLIDPDNGPHPVVRYEKQRGKDTAVEAHIIGFPYVYRLA